MLNIFKYFCTMFIFLLFIPNYSYSWTSITNWTSNNEDGWYIWNSAGTAIPNVTFRIPQPDGSQIVLKIITPAGTSSNSGLQIAGASRQFPEENEMWAVYYLFYPDSYTFHPIAEKISGWEWPTTDSSNMLLVWKWGKLAMSSQLGWMDYVEFSSNTGYNPSQIKNHWFKITEHVKINTPGQRDGIYEVWVDDKMVMSHKNVPYRSSNDRSGFNKFKRLLVWGGQGGGITLSSDMYLYFGTTIISSQILGTKNPMSPSNLLIK